MGPDDVRALRGGGLLRGQLRRPGLRLGLRGRQRRLLLGRQRRLLLSGQRSLLLSGQGSLLLCRHGSGLLLSGLGGGVRRPLLLLRLR